MKQVQIEVKEEDTRNAKGAIAAPVSHSKTDSVLPT